MKTLTRSILIGLCITLLNLTQLLAQEWSDEQKEVWKNLETGWDLWAKQDLKALMATYHEDFSGWEYQEALPANKASARKTFTHQFKTIQVLIYDIQPVAIKIYGSVAIVHYYWSSVNKNTEGKEINLKGRYTDMFMKEGDKWIYIGGAGGVTE